MRGIIKKKDNTKRNQLILGLFLVLLMVFSTLGYALGSGNNSNSNQKINYNGVEFIQDDSGYWGFIVQNTQFMTRYTPEETKDIVFFNSLSLNDYTNKPLYFEGEIGEPVSEISRNLGERFVLRIQEACLDEDCERDLPIKNCSTDNVISIKQVPENGLESIYQEQNCIFIVADYSNQTLYADKLLFSLLGI